MQSIPPPQSPMPQVVVVVVVVEEQQLLLLQLLRVCPVPLLLPQVALRQRSQRWRSRLLR